MNNLKGIYLAACKARHPNHNIIYQDIDPKFECDLKGDMLKVDLTNYDYIIATPPCNYWSKANPYYWHSEYAWKTINLLPLTLIKLAKSGKPFIVENIINRTRFKAYNIYRLAERLQIKVIEVGRHTYFTNKPFNLNCDQQQDFVYGGKRINNDGYNQGGKNVHKVIEKWLTKLEEEL